MATLISNAARLAAEAAKKLASRTSEAQHVTSSIKVSTPMSSPTAAQEAPASLPEVTIPKKGVSTRCFVEYEIDLSGTEIKLHTSALFKKVMKIGTKFFVVAELIGNHMPEYSLEIVTVRAMHYIPLSAKYIDSIVIAGDEIAHFFVQPKGASTDPLPMAKELLGHEVRRPNAPQREEDMIRNGDRKGALARKEEIYARATNADKK